MSMRGWSNEVAAVVITFSFQLRASGVRARVLSPAVSAPLLRISCPMNSPAVRATRKASKQNAIVIATSASMVAT